MIDYTKDKYSVEEIMQRRQEVMGKMCICGHPSLEHREPHTYNIQMACAGGGL